MGLDMYLFRDTFLGSENNEGEVVLKNYNDKTTKIDLKRIQSVREEIIYWRKNNWIHAWFVRNVQEGKDDCAEYHLTGSKLADLLNDCNKVLADHSLAESILPVQSGFFFGPTTYDDWYFEATKNTADKLTEVLKEFGAEANFVYTSSW
jgi:hypothetical protein